MVVVSPWTAKGTVDSTVYDHASVAATLERLFGFPPLTDRDKEAHDLRGLLSLGTPRTDAPTTLPNPAPPAAPTVRESAAELGSDDDEPVDAAGTLAGFLGAALKARCEVSAATEGDRRRLIEEFQSIRTRGQARDFLAKAATAVTAATAATAAQTSARS